MQNINATKRNQDHITHYQARTLKPLKAYALTGNGARVIPGGCLVQVTENTAHDPERTVYTATVYLDGLPYESEIQPAQFTQYHPNPTS